MPEYCYLAIDPGETSGWAKFDENGDIMEMGQIKLSALGEFNLLIHEGLEEVIVEDYRNHGYKAQKRWGRNETSKIIGRIETLCELAGVTCIKQPNTAKPMGYKYMGMEQPKNHSISHQWDAAAHGVYRLQGTGIRPMGRSMMKDKP